jgi:uncharacterized UBP type Zn finger protein
LLKHKNAEKLKDLLQNLLCKNGSYNVCKDFPEGEQEDVSEFFYKYISPAVLSVGYGILVNEKLKCAICDNVKECNVEKVSMLGICMNNMVDRYQYIQDLLSNDMIREVSCFCSNCQLITNMIKTTMYKEFPNTVLIQLCRYISAEGSGFKKSTPVIPDESIILNGELFFLHSIVCHKGILLNSGHYITYRVEIVDGVKCLLKCDDNHLS